MKQALRIAKGFQYGISREAHMAMQMAYECMVHPEFYRAIGKDIDGIIQSGIEAVNVLYG